MSFEIYLGIFRGGEASTVDRSIPENSFKPFIKNREQQLWVLNFPDGSNADLYLGSGTEIDGFMVARPPHNELFWVALLDVMRKTKGVVYWPGGGAVVADPSHTADLPGDMIQALGRPSVISDPSEFRAIIENA